MARRENGFVKGFKIALLALAGMVVLALLPVDAAAQQTTKTWVVDAVDAGGSRFVSADNGTSEITVEVGDTVRWEFDQATMGHNIQNNSPNWSISEYRDPGGAPVERTFTQVGEYRYLCSLHGGMTGTINVVADVPNSAPTADPLVDPKDGPAPLYVHFEARATDPDGDPLTYRWDFGDNSPVSTADHAHHTYSEPGTYAATLKVSDGKGGEYDQTFPITASGPVTQAPTVDGSANPTTGDAPLSVTFMASGQDPQGDTVTLSWDFGDPNTDTDKATGNRVFYQYTQPGTYTATVTGRDPGGNTGTDTVQIVVSQGGDTTAPETEITAGPSDLTKYPSASFWFLSSEPGDGAGFDCSLDGSAFSPCFAPQGYEGLSSGQHTFRVRAVDAAKNADATPAERTWTVDADRPYVGGLKPRAGSSVRDRTPRIQATVRDSQTDLAKDNVGLFLDGRAVGTFSYDPETDVLSRVPSSPLSYGSHTVKVTGTDGAGNTTAKKWRFNVKRR